MAKTLEEWAEQATLAEELGDVDAELEAREAIEQLTGGQSEGILTKLLAPLEVGAAMVTELPARAAGGVAGLASAPFVGQDRALEIQESVSDLAFPVTSQTGQAIQQGIAELPIISDVGEFVQQADLGAQSLGGMVTDVTGSPTLGTAVRSVGGVIPEAAELLAIRGAAKGELPQLSQQQPTRMQEPTMNAPSAPPKTPEELTLEAELEMNMPSTPSQVRKMAEDIQSGNVQKVVEDVDPVESIVNAAREEGYILSPDQYSSNSAFIETIQALKSANPEMRGDELAVIERLGKDLEKLKTSRGGYTDIAAANSAVGRRYQNLINKIKAEESKLSQKLDDAIYADDLPQMYHPENIYNLVKQQARKVGGVKNLKGTWKEMHDDLMRNTPLDEQGMPVGVPTLTYDFIKQMRQDIGSGYKKEGRFKDSARNELDAFYAALAQDQRSIARRYGVEDVLDARNKLTAERKGLEDSVTDFKGVVEYDENGRVKIKDTAVVQKLQPVIARAAQGDLGSFNEYIEKLPKDLREPLVLTSLDPLLSSKVIKTGDITGRMAEYGKLLKRNPEAKEAIYKHLSPEVRTRLDNLFEISEGIFNSANRQNSSRTARDVLSEMDKNFEKLFKVYDAGTAATQLADPTGASGLAANLARVGMKVQASKKGMIQKADRMINSQKFKDAMDEYLGGNEYLAQQQLKKNPAYQKWVKSLNKADRDIIEKVGMFNWWLRPSEEEEQNAPN